ncbi:hypothetical protein SAMN05216337_1003230 [Bradyrhizobium brasilense]|uniref:Uncharacterized protein n=1 Tax=Bradyrhizobium brasilense TaxID=1419277 RepID=A0A1G6MEC9_9BRAD|nr:hypothetical protein SAMN05216337_1003230 [Bradyrhizobium brasilense]
MQVNEFEFIASGEFSDPLRKGSKTLWFYCNLVYLDFMQVRRESGFCWRRAIIPIRTATLSPTPLRHTIKRLKSVAAQAARRHTALLLAHGTLPESRNRSFGRLVAFAP